MILVERPGNSLRHYDAVGYEMASWPIIQFPDMLVYTLKPPMMKDGHTYKMADALRCMRSR